MNPAWRCRFETNESTMGLRTRASDSAGARLGQRTAARGHFASLTARLKDAAARANCSDARAIVAHVTRTARSNACPNALAILLAEREEGGFGIGEEGHDLRDLRTQEPHDALSRTIPEANPYHFRGESAQHREPVKVLILGDEHEIVRLRMRPDRFV